MNVATWLKWRRPGNRVAKYFISALNRLGREYDSQLAPVYISTRRNSLQGEQSRLNIVEARGVGTSEGYTSVDLGGSSDLFHGEIACVRCIATHGSW